MKSHLSKMTDILPIYDNMQQKEDNTLVAVNKLKLFYKLGWLKLISQFGNEKSPIKDDRYIDNIWQYAIKRR